MKAQKTFESPEPTLYDVIDVMKVGFDRVEDRLNLIEANITSFRSEVKNEFAAFRLENRLEHQEINTRLSKLEVQNEDKTYRIEEHEGRLTNIESWREGVESKRAAGA